MNLYLDLSAIVFSGASTEWVQESVYRMAALSTQVSWTDFMSLDALQNPFLLCCSFPGEREL